MVKNLETARWPRTIYRLHHGCLNFRENSFSSEKTVETLCLTSFQNIRPRGMVVNSSNAQIRGRGWANPVPVSISLLCRYSQVWMLVPLLPYLRPNWFELVLLYGSTFCQLQQMFTYLAYLGCPAQGSWFSSATNKPEIIWPSSTAGSTASAPRRHSIAQPRRFRDLTRGHRRCNQAWHGLDRLIQWRQGTPLPLLASQTCLKQT